MFRIVVRSGSISSIGYDATRHLLEIEFRRTMEVFHYEGVPSSEYRGLMSAESKGEYFNSKIRDAGYVCRKVSS